MKNIFLVAGTYIAALIGAGLASGAESVIYFARFGKWGAVGIVVCSIIFTWFLYALLSGMKRTNSCDFGEYLEKTTSKSIRNICNISMLLFMICVYSAMVTGVGELASCVMGADRIISMAVFSLICIFIILMPIQRIMNLCGSLGIIIGIIIIIFSFRFMTHRGIEAVKLFDNWLVSSISYSGYNILSSAAILCPMAVFMNGKKQIGITSVLSGVGIFLILMCMYCACGIYFMKINLGTFPMLTLASRQGVMWYTIYVAVFFTAILTTAISSAYGIYTSLCDVTGSKISLVMLYIISMALSYLGFEALVSTVYMICGIVGIIVPITVIKNEIKKI